MLSLKTLQIYYTTVYVNEIPQFTYKEIVYNFEYKYMQSNIFFFHQPIIPIIPVTLKNQCIK